MTKQKEVSSRYCECKKWKKNWAEVSDIFWDSWNHGEEYRGESFEYCPWCRSKLKI